MENVNFCQNKFDQKSANNSDFFSVQIRRATCIAFLTLYDNFNFWNSLFSPIDLIFADSLQPNNLLTASKFSAKICVLMAVDCASLCSKSEVILIKVSAKIMGHKIQGDIQRRACWILVVHARKHQSFIQKRS